MKYKNTIGAILMLGLTIYCIVTPFVWTINTIFCASIFGLYFRDAIKEWK